MLHLFITSFGSSMLHIPPFPDILFPVLFIIIYMKVKQGPI